VAVQLPGYGGRGDEHPTRAGCRKSQHWLPSPEGDLAALCGAKGIRDSYVRIPAKPITYSDLMAITIPMMPIAVGAKRRWAVLIMQK